MKHLSFMIVRKVVRFWWRTRSFTSKGRGFNTQLLLLNVIRVKSIIQRSAESCEFSFTLLRYFFLFFLRWKNQHAQIREGNCFIDVLQLGKNNYIQEMSWKHVATWNGDTLQTCSYQETSSNVILSPSIRPVFRVPIVEYFPYLIKHEKSGNNTECLTNSLPCYEQQLRNDNSTVSAR